MPTLSQSFLDRMFLVTRQARAGGTSLLTSIRVDTGHYGSDYRASVSPKLFKILGNQCMYEHARTISCTAQCVVRLH